MACNQAVSWDRSRHWCAPAPHPLIQRALQGSPAGTLRLQCSLTRPALAYLHDHQVSEPGTHRLCLACHNGVVNTDTVGLQQLMLMLSSMHTAFLGVFQVFGQVLLPGAAMLEAALSSAVPLLDAAIPSATSTTPLLQSVTIPAPLALTPRRALVLECMVVLAGSAAGVTVQSRAGDKHSAAVHLRGSYSAIAPGDL